ncbi:hypothetical protein G6O67_004435 [Ophiocordyceps sinensis]|uniref:Uncharacterized protein n=1 Tax=Ophiocordyceps sinensis TaxID=72228 RepID=A0A8H4PMV5_9HYPO|nr:hypothetical protein G6O67_004435 [Ophiocordyceps sinensis]
MSRGSSETTARPRCSRSTTGRGGETKVDGLDLRVTISNKNSMARSVPTAVDERKRRIKDLLGVKSRV